MKSFRLLTRQIGQWRQVHLTGTSAQKKRLRDRVESDDSSTASNQTQPRRHSFSALSTLEPGQILRLILSPQKQRKSSIKKQSSASRMMVLVAVASLTSTIGYRFYNEPKLAVNTIAPQTLRAPSNAVVEDSRTTEESRRAARLGAVPVLMVDQSVNQEIYQSLQRVIDEGNYLRQTAGAFPFVETSLLSTATQQYLRRISPSEWQKVLLAVDGDSHLQVVPDLTLESSGLGAGRSTSQIAVIELRNYQRTHSVEDFAALKQVINRSRDRYLEAIAALAIAQAEVPVSAYSHSLFDLTDAEWDRTKSGIRQALERILIQGIPQGLPNSVLEEAVRMQVSLDVPPSAVAIATNILLNVAKANLVIDQDETRLRAEQAAQAVKPEMVEIRRGEIMVRAGETISQSDFVLLDHFGMSRRGVNWWALAGFTGWVSVAIFAFSIAESHFHPGLRRRDYILVWLLTLSTPLMLLLGVSATSLPLVGLLIGSFYGSGLGVTVVSLLGITLPIGMEIGWSYLAASTISSLVGAFMAGRLRSREELALLGGAVGLTQGFVFLMLSLILSSPGLVWYGVLTAAGFQTLLGIVWSVVALGLSPYLEHLFDLVTPIRLAELSNPNRPMLKRLASEAPGTFQHTLFVASLAEAAARALGCNVELVRAGTLYHDIGKMHDSMCFIENQMGGPNKHDAINNPWKSAEIIKKHVSEGLVMARKCRLPKAIQAFIPEHQGTMLISYFYHEAMQRAKENPDIAVKEADFRYRGPIPQSRETGIVMLADSCEAALRSLKDATSEEALAMVNRILRARWQDDQLVESGLTRAEMSIIAEIFVRVWQQFNHQRIAYPKATSSKQRSSIRN